MPPQLAHQKLAQLAHRLQLGSKFSLVAGGPLAQFDRGKFTVGGLRRAVRLQRRSPARDQVARRHATSSLTLATASLPGLRLKNRISRTTKLKGFAEDFYELIFRLENAGAAGDFSGPAYLE